MRVLLLSLPVVCLGLAQPVAAATDKLEQNGLIFPSPVTPSPAISLSDIPTKNDTRPVDVEVPADVDGIYWLNMKVPVGNTYRFQGYFADKQPWVSQGVEVARNSYMSSIWLTGSTSKTPTRQDFTISQPGLYPVTYQVSSSLNGGEGLLLRAHLYGWGGTSNYCENFADNHGYLSVRNCSSEYPNYDMTGGKSNWAFYGGHSDAANASNENGARIAESLLSVAARHRDSIDLAAGFTLMGTSYGGTGSILQSMILPRIQRQLSVVYSLIPQTMFLKTDYRRNPQTQKAWQGIDPNVVNFNKVAATGKLDHIFYRIHGGSNDEDRNQTEFYAICNRHKIACLGTWHGGGHSSHEQGVNIPADLYPGDPNMQARLDTVLPVFTQSSGNTPLDAERGHYNLGLSWNAKQIVSTDEKLVIPLRYRAFKNMSADPTRPVADMPDTITASVTIRRSPVFSITPGSRLRWAFGDQKGVARAHRKKSEVTIKSLRFNSSDSDYTRLVIKPAPPKKPSVST